MELNQGDLEIDIDGSLDDYFKDFTADEMAEVQNLLSSKDALTKLKDLGEDVYRYKCPTPEEFLEEWLHPGIRDKIYPEVKKAFFEMWDFEKNYREIILYGGTRNGKSTSSRLGIVYCVVFLFSLRSPHDYYGISLMSTLSIFLMSFSKSKASDLLLAPIMAILNTSPKFHRVQFHDQLEPTQKKFGGEKIVWTTAAKIGEIAFSNNVSICLGSDPMDIIGADIILAVISEINFFIKNAGITEEDVWTTYQKTKGRILGTVSSTCYGSRIYLDSSALNRDSIIENYILTEASKNPKVFFWNKPRWEVNTKVYPIWKQTKETFKVFVGTQNRAPAIVTDTFRKEAGDENYFIDVPVDSYSSFKEDIRGSLNDECVSGDTLIPLLSGDVVPIKDLVGKSVEVYSCTPEGHIAVGVASNIHSNGFRDDILRVWLDNGNYIDCTSDHQFMLRDGTYAEAKDLQKGTSLMPLYIEGYSNNPDSGAKMYLKVKNNKSGHWRPVHRLVFRKELEKLHFENMHRPMGERIVVHHKDFNKHNNTRENLQLMTWDEHRDYHNDVGRTNLKKLWENPEYRAYRSKCATESGARLREQYQQRFKGEGNPAYREDITVDRILTLLDQGMSRRKIEETLGITKATIWRRLESAGYPKDFLRKKYMAKRNTADKVNLEEFKKLILDGKTIKDISRIPGFGLKPLGKRIKSEGFSSVGEYVRKIINPPYKSRSKRKDAYLSKVSTEDKLFASVEGYFKLKDYVRGYGIFRTIVIEACERLKVDYKVFLRHLIKRTNHKVTYIENLPRIEVFDMTVPKYHNFATHSGVFVHNCGIPSGSSDLYFPDWDVFNLLWDDNILNVSQPVEAPIHVEPKGHIMTQVRDILFKKDLSGKYALRRASSAPRWVRIDLSEAENRTGIAIVHPEIRDNGSLLCVFDIAFDVRPVKGGINLEAVLSFVRELYLDYGVQVAGVSSDRYQSSYLKQSFMRDDQNYIMKSVDDDKSPYQVFKSKIVSGLCKMGRYRNLENNLKSLIETTNKIDHTAGRNKRGAEADMDIGRHSKDISDAASGAVFHLMSEVAKHPVTFNYDDINRVIENRRSLMAIQDMSEAGKAELLAKLEENIFKNRGLTRRIGG